MAGGDPIMAMTAIAAIRGTVAMAGAAGVGVTILTLVKAEDGTRYAATMPCRYPSWIGPHGAKALRPAVPGAEGETDDPGAGCAQGLCICGQWHPGQGVPASRCNPAVGSVSGLG